MTEKDALPNCGCGAVPEMRRFASGDERLDRVYLICRGCGMQTGYWPTEDGAEKCWACAMTRAPALEALRAMVEAFGCVHTDRPEARAAFALAKAALGQAAEKREDNDGPGTGMPFGGQSVG